MTLIETKDVKNYQKDPEKFYEEVFGGLMEFDDVYEHETWLKQN